MDIIISFFRDTLDGTTYVIVCSVSAVLLCACIGYLADKKSKKESPEQPESNDNKSNKINFSISDSATSESQTTPPVTPEPLENVGVVENPVPPQSNNIAMPVNQPEQVGEQIPQTVPQEQPVFTQPSEQVPQTSPVIGENINPETSPVAQPTGNMENEVLTQPTTEAPQMPDQTQIPTPEQTSQIPTSQQPEQPIFPPVDNNASPIGITPPPVEATAPIPQIGEQVPQEQPVFTQPSEQVPQTPPVIGENINPEASQVAMANANPNLNIQQEGIPQQPVQQQVPLPSEVSPSMEAANLDMPQMPVEGTEQPVQAETLDNIADATEQIEEEQIIDNPTPTAVAETPTEQPAPQEVVGGQVGEQIPQPQQAVAPQNIETGNNPQTIGQ